MTAACGATAATSEGDVQTSEVAPIGDAASCVCADVGTCCDGCSAKANNKKCISGAGGWGTCQAGACAAVPGSIAEWSVASGDGVGVMALAALSQKRLAVVAADATALTGEVALWDAQAQQRIWTQPGFATGVAALANDATLLVVGAAPVRLVALADGATQVTLPGTMGPVAASRDGKRVAATTTAQVQLFTPGGDLLLALDHPETPKARHHAVAFAPDGATLASATGQNGLGSPHGEVKLFALKNPADARTITCTSMDVAFAPDSQRLLTACWNTLALWDVATAKQLAAGFEKDDVLAVAWSPDGKWLASGTLTGGAKLYLAATYTGDVTQPFATLPVPQVAALAFSPDSQTLYVGTGTKPSVYAWTLPIAGP